MYRTAIAFFVTCTLFANALDVTSAQEESGAEAEKEVTTGVQSPWVTDLAQIGNSSTCVASTGDGLLLREATVYRFEASNPGEMTPIYKHPAAVWQVVSSSDGRKIASVDYRGNLGIYDTGNQPIASAGDPWKAGPEAKLTTHEKAFERWCQALLMTPDDKFLIAGNEAGKLFVWDIAAGKITKTAELDGHAVTGLTLSPEGESQLAVSDGAGHVHLFSWPAIEPQGKVKVSDETVWCVAYTAPGKLIAGSSDRNLYQIEAKADSKAESVGKGSDWITQIAISPAGRVAAAEVGGKVHFPKPAGETSKNDTTADTLGDDSMKAKSGIWALQWISLGQGGDDQLLVGTRKNGILTAGRSWKWTEPATQAKPKPPVKDTAKETDGTAVQEDKKEEEAKTPPKEETEEPDTNKEDAGKPAKTEKKE